MMTNHQRLEGMFASFRMVACLFTIYSSGICACAVDLQARALSSLRSKFVDAFFFDKAISAEEWGKFEAKPWNHSEEGKFEREARWVDGYEVEGVRQ
jgi:hypothetical protein